MLHYNNRNNKLQSKRQVHTVPSGTTVVTLIVNVTKKKERDFLCIHLLPFNVL